MAQLRRQPRGGFGLRGFAVGLGVWIALAARGGAARANSVSLAGNDSGALVRWPTNKVSYKLHPNCSADLDKQQCLNGVRAAFQAWTGQGCSSLSFQEDTSAWTNNALQLTAFGYENGKNEFVWIEDNRWVYGEYVLGVTVPYFDVQSGAISEADIVFNGYLQTWQMDGADYSTDVVSVAVHEIGHFIGLQHVLYGFSENDPPTMAPEQDSFMKSRTPNADDLAGVCFLYPSGAFQCASNADCPLVVGDGANGEYYVGQLACDGQGRCGGISNALPEPTQELGESCVGDGDCKDQMTCYPIGAGRRVCASECTTNPDSCPNGYDCTPYSNQPSLGLCFAGQAQGTAPNGASCSSSNECASRLCAPDSGGPVCREPCHSSGECAASETCQAIPGAGLGACVAGQTTPTVKDNGAACESSDQCKSGLCAGSGFNYVCSQPCSSGAPCPGGFTCVGLGGGGGACFQNENKGVGDTCEDGSECLSGLCFLTADETSAFCAGRCTTHADCPCKMQCETLQYYDAQNQLRTEKLCNPGLAIACLPPGAACTSESECAGGACFHGACEVACPAVLAGGGCPSGQGCARIDASGVDGICQPPGGKPAGDACGQDNACASLFCNANTCATPCNPFGANTCGPGRVCGETATSQLGVCQAAPEDETGPEVGPDEPGPDGPAPDGDDTVPATAPPSTQGGVGGQHSGCAAGPGDGLAGLLAALCGAQWARRRRSADAGFRIRSRG